MKSNIAAKKTENHQKNDAEISISEAWELFVAFLRRRQCRVTEARRIILEHVFRRKDHFRADEVAQALGKGEQRVSRGTVYHTLALLVEAGLVRELRDRDTHVHYESARDMQPHHHMVCGQCGKFIEFQEPRLDHLVDAACAREGFLHQSHQLVINGICADCARGRRG